MLRLMVLAALLACAGSARAADWSVTGENRSCMDSWRVHGDEVTLHEAEAWAARSCRTLERRRRVAVDPAAFVLDGLPITLIDAVMFPLGARSGPWDLSQWLLPADEPTIEARDVIIPLDRPPRLGGPLLQSRDRNPR